MARIAFISTMRGYAWGGSEELWHRTAEAALARKHQVLISVHDWGEALHPKIKSLEEKGALLDLRQSIHTKRSIPLKVYHRLQKQLSIKSYNFQPLLKFKPDCICISQGATFELIFIQELVQMLANKTFPYCVICQMNHENGVLPYTQLLRARAVFSNAKMVFFASQRNKSVAERQMALDLPNAQVLYSFFNGTDIRALPWLQSETACFASAARLDCAYKGQDILLQVFSADVWKNRNWQLQLYGTGPDRQYLQELVSYYALDNRVHFMGQAQKMPEIWAQTQVLLMPSIAEGTPIVLMDAMAHGRPAIVSDVGGHAEMIAEPLSGFVSEAASPYSFGAALERAWRAKAQWNSMGMAAHHAVNQKADFSPEHTLLERLIQ